MTTTRIFLLPPSERKRPGGGMGLWKKSDQQFASLNAFRLEAVKALQAQVRTAAEAKKAFGIGEAALGGEMQAAQELSQPTGLLPALTRYNGVFYVGLSPQTLSSNAFSYAETHCLIFSGLFGVLSGSDEIPYYRLKMGTRLAGMGRMSDWWQPKMQGVLQGVLRGADVVDFLPLEHARAWSPNAFQMASHTKVEFLQEGGGRRIVLGHAGKHIKGRLLRHLLENSDEPLSAALDSFTEEGFGRTPGTGTFLKQP